MKCNELSRYPRKSKQHAHNLCVLSNSFKLKWMFDNKFILTLTFECVVLSAMNSLLPRPSGHRGGSKSSQSFQSDSRCVKNKSLFSKNMQDDSLLLILMMFVTSVLIVRLSEKKIIKFTQLVFSCCVALVGKAWKETKTSCFTNQTLYYFENVSETRLKL